ncbi:hypothetical protein GALMADRAFT_79202, partial [Galerina marginata CBS 339.88]
DTCRICSAPAEPDQPLFHPCKCSGTIRYIHQDCLTTWLAHSKKKNCDVCKHPYSFTKVYATDMPSSLPPILLIRRLIQQVFLALLFVFRAIAVAAIWLGVLPWVTVWTWRMYFSMGESTAWWISDRPRPPTTENNHPSYLRISYENPAPPPKTILQFITRFSSHPLWLALSADIFTGQIIASLIVLTFVAVFLLREWISQNARPGVFEEEEVLPEEPAPLQPQAAGQPGQQLAEGEQRHDRHDGFPEPDVLVQRQLDAMRAVNAMRQNIDPEIAMDPDRWYAAEENDPSNRRLRRKKNKARHLDTDEDRLVRHRRRTSGSGDDTPNLEMEAMKRKMFHRRIHVAKTTAARRRVYSGHNKSPAPSAPLALSGEQSSFDFTFRAPSPVASSSEQALSTSVSEPSSIPPYSPGSSTSSPPPADEETSPFPSVALQPPSGEIPFSLRRWQETNTSPPAYPARPPLPFTAASRSGSGSPFNFTPGRTPMDSPKLATYRAPEELEPESGPSAERNRYFHLANGPEAEEGAGEHEARSEADDLPELQALSDSDDDDSDEDGDDDEHDGDADDHEHDGDEEDEMFLEGEEDDDEEAEADGDLFDDGQWEEPEVEAAAPPVMPNAAGAPAPAQGANPEADAAAAGPDIGDDAENVEDDMEGAMEAIGMRGPIYGVVQNAALMIFVLDTAIGLGVWIPFTIGKTTALLSLDPRRMLQVLHLPVRAMRLVTDPIVDFVAWIIVDLFFPRVAQLFGAFFHVIMFFGSISAGKLFGKETKLMSKPLARFVAWTSSSNVTEEVVTQSNFTSIFAANLPDYLGFTEPYFEILGREVRVSTTKFQSTWIQLALGSGPSSRLFAVALGYLVVIFLFCLYLNILTVGNAKSAGLAVRNAVRQQLLVLKVATFIFIELVTFPLGCGIVLDLCTVWLFPEANLQSRVAFFAQAPLTAMFYHWVAGTMFMYSFAVLLSGCRSVMRPGAMWFIKDPQDQNSHPIRDILDRPTLVQLRKICVSGIMYSFVVACVVGSVAGLLVLGSKSIMPFRWKNREPLSNVPVDLLFLHLVLPYTMHYFRPKRAIKHVSTTVWKFLAVRLRLTSYFFGGRYPQEEYTPKDWRANFIQDPVHVVGEDEVPDGSFRRVPATDNLALPRDMRATVAVTPEGEPVDDAAKELMALQDAEADKAKRTIKDDYMVVYMPPYFRYRIITFITLLWIFGAFFLGFGVALPIQLGRSFFRLFTTRDVHDGYSFIIGFYLIWICYLIAKAVDRLDKRRQRRSGDRPRAELPVLVVKRGFLWAAKALYMAFFLGVVIPVLLAIVIDLYIVLPIRFVIDPEMMPRIRVVDTWALGLLYAKIALHAHRIQPPNRITRGLQHIMTHGWTRPDPIAATREVIAPLAGGLLGMILLPGTIFRVAQQLFPDMPLDNRFIFMHVYPAVFIFAGTIRSAIVAYGLLSSWSQKIRDKEFLVEMRLKNHEPDKVNMSEGADATANEVEEAMPEEEVVNRDNDAVVGDER